MQIKMAEDEIGSQIFNRDHNPIRLSQFGESIIPYLRAVQDNVNALNVLIQKSKGIYKAEVRLGIIPTIADYLVPELYGKWLEELGDVHLEIIELKSEQIIEHLEQRKIDIGIMAGPYDGNSLHERILYNEEILIYAPGFHKPKISEEELAEMKPWLLSEGNCLRTQMMNFCNLKEDTKKDWSYEGGSLSLLLRMVDQQGGYTLLPNCYTNIIDIPKRNIKHLAGHTAARQIIALHHKRSSKTEVLNDLIAGIQQANKGIRGVTNKVELLPWK
jgi:LysR family hydrogen peroxide-inducible transcriptional activator